MKIWLDDIRPMPFYPKDDRETYPFDRYAPYDVQCFTAEEAIKLIDTGEVRFISFDHDLGVGKTGYDVAKHIEELAYLGRIPIIYFKVHSSNPVGRENIITAMNSAGGYWLGKV